MELLTIDSVSFIAFPQHLANNGSIVIMEGLKNVPFEIARVFVVMAEAGSIRGQHAHRCCTQLLICQKGSIEVICDDGQNTKSYLLDKPNMGLFIPRSIWAQQNYLKQESILTVLCDRPYEVEDYIHEYEEYKAYRKEEAGIQ